MARNGNGGGNAATMEAPATTEAAAEKPKRVVKPRPKKVLWGERGEDGKLVQVLDGKSLPEGFDPAKHEKLVRSDFVDGPAFYDYRALTFTAMAQAATDKAAELRSGKPTVAAQQRKLLKLKSAYEELLAELAASGEDVSALVGE
jgi:hypothetical protein